MNWNQATDEELVAIALEDEGLGYRVRVQAMMELYRRGESYELEQKDSTQETHQD